MVSLCVSCIWCFVSQIVFILLCSLKCNRCAEINLKNINVGGIWLVLKITMTERVIYTTNNSIDL